MTPDNDEVLIDKIIKSRFEIHRHSPLLTLMTGGMLHGVTVRAIPVTEGYTSDPNKPIDSALAEFVHALNSKGPDKVRRKTSDLVYNTVELHKAIQTKWEAVFADTPASTLSVDFEAPLGLLHRVHPTEPWRWIRIDGGSGYFGSNIYRTTLPNGSYQSIAIQFV